MTIAKAKEKEIVICDLTNCLNCGNCIIACERRHKDISRHTRAVSTIIGISLFPNLCMVCNDPKCIEACNHEGLERDENGPWLSPLPKGRVFRDTVSAILPGEISIARFCRSARDFPTFSPISWVIMPGRRDTFPFIPTCREWVSDGNSGSA